MAINEDSMLLRILRSPLIIIGTSFVLGLLVGDLSSVVPIPIDILALGPLIVIMTFSTIQISLRPLWTQRSNMREYLIVFGLHYGVFTAILLLTAWLIVPQPAIWTGFIVMAAMPPAAAVIPFTVLMRADTHMTTGALIVLYFASFGVAPAMVWIFTGGQVDLLQLLRVLVLIILLPLAISRILLRFECGKRLGPWNDVIIMFGFFVLIFVLIGSARAPALASVVWLLPIGIVLTIRTFVTGLAVGVIAKRRGVPAERSIPYLLFCSYKNGGLSAVMAFSLYGPLAALPSVLSPFFEFGAFLIFRHLDTKHYFAQPNASAREIP